MRILAFVLLVATTSALPRKPTKDFPKKYDAALDGPKDTYITYEVVPDERFFLIPPSSYDAYFERLPQDPILVPDVSTYTDEVAEVEGEEMLPPPEDTYSVHPGSGHFPFVPPPTPEVAESYASYRGTGQESLVAPPLSSYANTPTASSGADVLASLAALVQSLPHRSSYRSYGPIAIVEEGSEAGPALELSPPSADQETEPEESSYSQIGEEQPPLTPEQIRTAEEANVPVPSTELVPPPKN